MHAWLDGQHLAWGAQGLGCWKERRRKGKCVSGELGRCPKSIEERAAERVGVVFNGKGISRNEKTH